MNLQPSGYEHNSYYLVFESLPCYILPLLYTQSPNAIVSCIFKSPNFNFFTLTKIAAARERIKLPPLKVLALSTL